MHSAGRFRSVDTVSVRLELPSRTCGSHRIRFSPHLALPGSGALEVDLPVLLMFADELAAVVQAGRRRDQLPIGLVAAREQAVTTATLTAAECLTDLLGLVNGRPASIKTAARQKRISDNPGTFGPTSRLAGRAC